MSQTTDSIQLAIAHVQGGRLEQAEAILDAATRETPDCADAWQLRGSVAGMRGEPDLACRFLRRALEIDPDCALVHFNLGNALRSLGQVEQAVQCYQRATKLAPEFVDAQLNLGRGMQLQGNLAEAVQCYERVLERRPNLADTRLDMALALEALGRSQEAIANYRHVVRLKPKNVRALLNLAGLLNRQGDFETALKLYEQAAMADPNRAESFIALGNVKNQRRQHTQAIRLYKRAVELAPEDPAALSSLLHASLNCCHWTEFDDLSRRVIAAVDAGSTTIHPFIVLSLATTAKQQRDCAVNVAAQRLKESKKLAAQLAFKFNRAPRSRIRLAYCSSDYVEHPVGRLMIETIEAHDRSQFEVFGYSLRATADSPLSQRFRGAFDKFVELQPLSFLESAHRIHEDGIDILIDLNGLTLHGRPEMLALRPAPVQVSYLGFPGTMGTDFVDYLLADEFLVPPDQQCHFTETLAYLPGWFWLDKATYLSSPREPSREDYDLPADCVVFCSFNNSYKITPQVFDVWMRLLKQVPGSVLWLYGKNDLVRTNLRDEAQRRDVAPERLVFSSHVPLAEYIARFRLADLFLDTTPYSAGMTAADALRSGCPVVTLVGQTFTSRMAGSLLFRAGLTELITSSLDQYEQMALELAQDNERLRGLRERLLSDELSTQLFDGGRQAQALESIYRQMWERYVADQAPEPIRVAEGSLHGS